MTRAAVVGLALAVVIVAFAVPYAVRGGFRNDTNVDAQAAVGAQAPAGPSAAMRVVALGGAAELPPLSHSPPRPKAAGGPTPVPAVPRVPVRPTRSAPRGVAPAGPAPPSVAPPKPAPSGGGGGGGSGGNGFFNSSG